MSRVTATRTLFYRDRVYREGEEITLSDPEHFDPAVMDGGGSTAGAAATPQKPRKPRTPRKPVEVVVDEQTEEGADAASDEAQAEEVTPPGPVDVPLTLTRRRRVARAGGA